MNHCKCCGQPLPKPPRPKPIPFNQEYYDKGRESGRRWDANWIPGGPFFTGNGERKSWLQGWQDGFNELYKANKRFARWWDVNHGRRPNCRYHGDDPT